MSEIKVALIHAGAREERTVTTGMKAWELYADDPAVIAARVSTSSATGSGLKDLAYELNDGDEVEGSGDRQSRTVATSCATPPPT